mmetsp:Transcript_444/g.667  ORF Transcript_444/g.667 Transcript_444/m.667 type:complete len:743 (-) Transcript_444:200-2428(-)
MSLPFYQLLAAVQSRCGCKRRQGSGKLSSKESGCTSQIRSGRIARTRTTSSTVGTCQAACSADDRTRSRVDNCSTRTVANIRNSDIGGFVATNKDIVKYSREGSQAMYNLLVQFSWEKRQLNAVNVATIFHSSAKTPDILTPDVLDYLTTAMQKADGFDARAIGNACYGFQGLKDSPSMHRVLAAMAAKVTNCTSDFNPQQAGNALYGLQNLRDSEQVRYLVQCLEPKITACKQPFSSQSIASACLGLRHLGNSSEVRRMFGAIAAKVEQLIEMSDPPDRFSSLPSQSFQLDGQAIGSVLNGLQSMDNSPEILRLILAVSIHAERVKRPMKAQELSSAFYGLRCLRGSPFEVRRLLKALCAQLKACTDYFMVRHIATILYGLRWLGDSDEARSVLLMCAEKIRMSSEPFDGHAIGNALYGLQGFPCCSEVQDVLDALAPKMDECQKILTGQEIGNAFYGFRSMLSDCDEVRRILVILTARLRECRYVDPQAISNALYGLHAFGNISEITSPIICILANRIRDCRDQFRPQAISNSFFGLQSMEDSPVARDILSALTRKLEECPENLTPTHLGNMLYNVRSFGDSEEIRNLLRVLKPRIKDCIGRFQDDDIAHAFLGVSGLGGYAEVRDIFQVLTPHVDLCHSLNAQDVSICLNALKSLSRVDEIRPLLKVLGSKVKSCGDRMLDHHLRKALHGVRQFGDSEDVRLIFRYLAEKAQQDGVSVSGTLLQRFTRSSKAFGKDAIC